MSQNTSSGFKLLAIRPLKGCNKKFLKVLKEGQVYQFYNDYEFKHEIENDIHSEIKEIKYTPSISTELYNTDSLNINISAVVGKNGSGKSSLFDLLFAGCYSIAIHLKIIEDENNSEEGQNNYPNTDLPLKSTDFIKQEIEAFNKIIDSIKLEIYYSIDDTYYRVIINGKTREQSSFTNNTWESQDIDLSVFFYTIAINYSHYALNSQEIGKWIISLFHKNDGYKTPVVLNPMRTDGNIDINKERKLLTRRMIANFLEPISGDPNDSLRNIGNNKIASELKCVFKYDFELTKDSFRINKSLSDIKRTFERENTSELNNVESSINDIIYESFFSKKHFLNDLEWVINNKMDAHKLGQDVDLYQKLKNALKLYESRKSIPDVIKKALTKHFNVDFTVFSEYGLEFLDVSLEYIYSKLKRIAQNKAYDYVEFLTNNELNGVAECNTENCINTFIGKLKNDNSHITFKIKGAILYLKYFKELGIVFKDKELGRVNNDKEFEISIQEISDEIVKIKNKEDFVINTTMMVPPSYFKTDVLLNNGLTIEQLSSGEKQQIHCNSSIIYHLINLNSVQAKSDGAKKTKYQYVNIYLDEIELYFHPEWQRSYLNNLLAMIKRINPANIKDIKAINICLATHSPYILSDIPTSNILFLKVEKGVSIPQKVEMNTFGANIHDLLANSFFLDNGFMGEFAKKKIEETIRFLNIKTNTKRIDEIVKLKLEESITKKEKSDLNEEIKYLENKNVDLKREGFNGDKEYHLSLINAIGEPIIKNKLQNMYFNIFKTDDKKEEVRKYILKLAEKEGINLAELK